jgi:hypothetical protein
LKEAKLMQVDKVLCKWFVAVHCKGKLVTGPTIIEKAKSFCNELKITYKRTLSEGCCEI